MPPRPGVHRVASLAVVGDLLEDAVVRLEGPVRRGTDTPARTLRTPGGSAADVAAAAAPHVPTRFLSRVGDDPLGELLVARLRSRGVDVRVQRGGRTGSVVVLVEPDGERTMLPDRGAAADLGPVPPDHLDGVGVLHVPAYALLGGLTAGSVRDLLEVARRTGVPTSLDAWSCSALELLGVAQVRRWWSGCARSCCSPTPTSWSRPPATTLLAADGTMRSVPVPSAVARDSTGAGDAFAAGWLVGLLTGDDALARVRRGHDLARRVLQVPGARPEEQA